MSVLIAAVQARLREAGTGARIKGAADLAALREQGEVKGNAIYVMRPDDSGRPRDGTDESRQAVDAVFVLVYAFRSFRDGRGEGAMGEVEQARAAARSAMLGWEPPGGFGAFQFARGRTLGMEEKALFFVEEWQVQELWTAAS